MYLTCHFIVKYYQVWPFFYENENILPFGIEFSNPTFHFFNVLDVSSPRGFSESKVKWISLILKPGLASYSPKTKNNTECNRQSNLYKKSLQESKLWAVQSKYFKSVLILFFTYIFQFVYFVMLNSLMVKFNSLF
jgi:hypothetical protein